MAAAAAAATTVKTQRETARNSNRSNRNDDNAAAMSGFQELLQKCEASLMPAIEEHVTNEAFDSARDGLDFLEVKNSLLLSYLIDLTFHVREKVSKKHDEDNFRRLMETRTVLDKTRPLEKKMRYQLDKLLAAATTSSFAAAAPELRDPLTFRPDPNSLMEGTQESDSSDDSDSDSDVGEADKDSDMDDFEAAAAAAAATTSKATFQEKKDNDGIYRAPRLTAMPYTLDEHDDRHDKERLRRRNQRLRQSELAQTLRAEYGEAPEQADIHGGGSDHGRQREAARRMAQRESEKIQMEEDNFIRLATSKRERKERNRLLREESSNLAAIANLGDVVRGVSSAFEQDSDDDDGDRGGGLEALEAGRYSNDKRRKSAVDEATGHSRKRSGRASSRPKNELQQALYGRPTKKSKKKKH